MPDVWKPKDPVLLKSWVEIILSEASDKLNDWESNFINNIGIRLDGGNTLTQRQEEHLERIYAEKTG